MKALAVTGMLIPLSHGLAFADVKSGEAKSFPLRFVPQHRTPRRNRAVGRETCASQRRSRRHGAETRLPRTPTPSYISSRHSVGAVYTRGCAFMFDRAREGMKRGNAYCGMRGTHQSKSLGFEYLRA